MTKNKIKPHKGGRTSRLDIRLSEDEKQEISDKAKQCGINKTDLIVAAVRVFQCPKDVTGINVGHTQNKSFKSNKNNKKDVKK